MRGRAPRVPREVCPVTRSKGRGAKLATRGPELQVKRVAAGSEAAGATGAPCGEAAGGQDLAMVLSKRVDDLKVAGFDERADLLMSRVEPLSGKMKGNCDAFARCGVRRARTPI